MKYKQDRKSLTSPTSPIEQADHFDGNRRLLTHRKPKNARTWRETVQATIDFYRPGGMGSFPAGKRRRVGMSHNLASWEVEKVVDVDRKWAE